MSSLLPINSTALERAVAEVGAKAEDLPVILRSLWNPDTCPVELLPWLAWAWSVDEWSASWSERQKRDTVKRALAVQSIKGTIGAVRDALGALGIDARVQEWFNQIPTGAPYTFKLWLESDQTPISQESMVSAIAVVKASKNLRSHLEQILVRARSEATTFAAVVTNTGNEITLSGYRPAVVVINELALNLGA